MIHNPSWQKLVKVGKNVKENIGKTKKVEKGGKSW